MFPIMHLSSVAGPPHDRHSVGPLPPPYISLHLQNFLSISIRCAAGLLYYV